MLIEDFNKFINTKNLIMRKQAVCSIPLIFVLLKLNAQIDAGLFRYPDVSENQIVFSYANDLWLVPREGGEAIKISSPPGVESFPKFSPDGKSIAFTGNYDGNKDAYALSVYRWCTHSSDRTWIY